MKATGIIRRVDDMGAVGIPRVIRQIMDIHTGDYFEAFTEGEDTVCFRKYKFSLSNEIGCLKNKIETYYDLPCDIEERIETLLEEVLELVKSEE